MGLGIPPAALWRLSWRELEAIEQVHREHHERQAQIWAFERAQFANANFRRDDGAKFEPDDFLPDSPAKLARRAASAEQRAQALRDKMDLQALQWKLSRIVPGGPEPEDLPSWARGPYRGKAA